MKTYTERMKELRNEKDKTQTEIAKVIGCKQRCYAGYELKQRDTPTDTLCQLADYYGVSTDYLLGRTNERKQPPKPKED